MKRKIGALALCALLFALSLSAQAQQPGKIPRIGFISGRGIPTSATPDPNARAFQQGLRDLGYTEGKNIVLELRYAEGKPDRAASLVSELLRLNVDVLVTPYSAAIDAAKQANKTIPIIIITLGEPVADGLVDSLARPGGNITGLTRLTRDLSGKRLELLKEVVPGISRVGILSDADTRVKTKPFKYYEPAAHALKIQLQPLEVRGPTPDLAEAFQTAVNAGVRTLIIVRTPLLIDHRKQIAELAIKNRLPLMAEGNDFVEAGCLMSYAASEPESFRRAATYVDKILKGRKPADLPVEQPTKFEFIINLTTAKQIGLTISPNVLAQADRIIK